MIVRMRFVSLFVVTVALFAIPAGAARGGEFRPLDMPDQKYQYQTERSKSQAPAEETYDRIYRRFEEDVRKKSPAEREDLKKFFSNKRNEAIKKEQWQEVKYYTGLLDILGKLSK